ncbi:MAG TPA: polysaccharide biosynthesis/export family protein [Desulfuromonadales bacterium]|nr:polysaccharide biosynthesis/export family protein [Desulfuromonadales bacterium]
MIRLLLFLSLAGFFVVAAQAEDYVIGGGDALQVSVWGVPELSGQFVVRPDGKITLPAAGDVAAAGQTPARLGENLAVVLGGFVKKPIVTVAVTGITNNRIYISGGGVPPAVVNLSGQTTLFKFLCGLQGLENADLRRAYLLRKGERMAVDFFALFWEGDFSRDLELRPEDILFIPNNERNKIYVLGAVNAPKYIYYRDGVKVLDAILEAGGFNEFASKNDVVIFRKDQERIRVKAKDLTRGKDLAQNVPLAPGDYVVVEEGFF